MSERSGPPLAVVAAYSNVYSAGEHLASLGAETDALTPLFMASPLTHRPIERATLQKVADAVQDLQNRVVIVHLAGHAGPNVWKLESDGRPGLVNAAELAKCFAGDPPPRLAFLNGCSTGEQTQALLDAGVGSVIGTTRAILDTTAKEFAERFYRGLIESDQTIAQAFEAAVSEARSQTDGTPRAILKPMIPGDASAAAEWPWRLLPEDGDHDWRLADAVDDPLYLLPLPPDLAEACPERPFRHLHWYTREDAPIFFGRGETIRELADLVCGDSSGRVVRLYGESGVGKSSLLEAGLQPRLQSRCDVRIRRRRVRSGLPGALRAALHVEPGHSLVDAWRAAEAEAKRPVAIVLDQAEEAFTQPAAVDDAPPHSEKTTPEFAALCRDLRNVFDADDPPQGRVVISFRKEWLAEVDAALGEGELPTTVGCHLRKLDRNGITEAILGPRVRFDGGIRFEVGESFAEEVRSDLLKDTDTPVAPVLQILLANEYDRAYAERPDAPRLDWRDGEHYGAENALEKHLSDAIGRIERVVAREGDPTLYEAVRAGLLLDLLAQHLTPRRTSRRISLKRLNERYAHLGRSVYPLLTLCAENHLLSFAVDQGDDNGTTTRLLHDILAGLVARRFERSARDGARAHRIIASAFAGVPPGELPEEMTAAQYRTIRRGRLGMRKPTNGENDGNGETTAREEDWIRASGRAKVKRVVGTLLALGLLVIGTWLVVNDTRTKAAQQAAKLLAEADAKLIDSVPHLGATMLGEERSAVDTRHREELTRFLRESPTPRDRIAAFNAAVLLGPLGQAEPAMLLQAATAIPPEKLPLLADAMQTCSRIDQNETQLAIAGLIRSQWATTSSTLPLSEDWTPEEQSEAIRSRPRRAAILMLLADRGIPFEWPLDWFTGDDAEGAAGRTELQLRLADELIAASVAGMLIPGLDGRTAKYPLLPTGGRSVHVCLPETLPDLVLATTLASLITHDRINWTPPHGQADRYPQWVAARLRELTASGDPLTRALAQYTDRWAHGQPDLMSERLITLSLEKPIASRISEPSTSPPAWRRVDLAWSAERPPGPRLGVDLVRIDPSEQDFTARERARERQSRRPLIPTATMQPATPNPAPLPPEGMRSAAELEHLRFRPPIDAQKPFYLATTETTQPLFLVFCVSGGFDASSIDLDRPPPTMNEFLIAEPETVPPSPVVRVEFGHAIRFCNWLTDLTWPGENGQPSPDRCYERFDDVSTAEGWRLIPGRRGFRLPTMAEWEMASRGRSAGRYSFGNVRERIHLYGNVGGDSRDPTADDRPIAVGLTLPNAYGLFETHGNVREWVWPDVPFSEGGRRQLVPYERLDAEDTQFTKDSSWLRTSDHWPLADFDGAFMFASTPSDDGSWEDDIGFRIAASVIEDAP